MSKRSQQIDALFRQGQQLHVSGRLAEAEAIYRQVLAAAPRHADALHALGALAIQAGRPDAAETLLSQAITIKAAAAFHLTRAAALLALKRPQEAAQVCRTVLRGQRNHPEALRVLGHALSDSGESEAAIEAYKNALRLKPALSDIRNDLGTALRHAGRLEEAEEQLRQAPAHPVALMNLSSVQKERGAFADAEATLQQALAMAPNDPQLLYNRALLMLLLGRPEKAWTGWESRFRAGAVPPRPFTQPQWQGETLNNRTLLVHAEQGLGDVIQFSRYLPAISGRVVFEAPARLIRLLCGNPAMPPMIPEGAPLPGFDVVAPLLSLAGRMKAPSASPPYLFAEPDLVAAWKDRIGSHGYRIGIAWQGFSGRYEDRGRSVPLSAYRVLASAPRVRLISLQKGEGEDQIASAGFPIERPGELDAGPDGFTDTAAVMMSLDLIITSDTSIAHLAGALGRPVWVALRRVPDWRWMIDRPDSPWYPSMRLFRQQHDGDWAAVFGAMTGELPR